MRRTDGIVLAFVLLAACREYGGVASLATTDTRLAAAPWFGTWRAPDALRCRRGDPDEETRMALPYHVFTVDTSYAGELRMVGTPDATCETPAVDTVEYRGTLVRLGEARVLEFHTERDDHSSLVPLLQWLRLTARADTIFLEALSADSLAAWLERAPTTTAHRLSATGHDEHGHATLVLTGDAAGLRRFVRRAFADPAMICPDTLVFVREPPDRAGDRRS